jgi:alpha-amylase/alpha-mannosidase (GH57 family)
VARTGRGVARDADTGAEGGHPRTFFQGELGEHGQTVPALLVVAAEARAQRAKVNLEQAARSFTDQEFRDLQVWFNLAWFGYAAERLYPEIAELKRKGGGFTEENKRVVFDQQQDILKNVLGYYKALAQRGQIELSTTPFYHPILPLVYHTEFARRCMPGRSCRRRFRIPRTCGRSWPWPASCTPRSLARRRTASGRPKVRCARS